MVVTEQRYATRAGVEVLAKGGNAVDAAIAVGYALAVVDPCCGNIGGGGFMLVRMHDGRTQFIDFRERAPLRATRKMYLDAAGNPVAGRSLKGWLSVGVPGTVAGLERARVEFGTRSRAGLLAPAIALARDGYRVTPGDAAVYADGANEVSGGPYAFTAQPNVASIFTRAGVVPQAGALLRQPQLAATLQTISDGGSDAFYRGPIARAVVAASDASGGILSLGDFSRYAVNEYAPVRCAYHGYTVLSAPPPSSGGVVLCEILHILAPYPLGKWGFDSVRSTHYVAEAERRAYADRNTYLGDPVFVPNPIRQLLDRAYAARLRSQIAPDRATPSSQVHPGLGPVASPEKAETTHYSIVDRYGNAVAVTYTINDLFGAGVIAGNTGFFLNDEMDDFTSKPGVPNLYGLVQGERNAVAPGKRPLSSMTPTIVTRGSKLAFVTGSPGGSRITTIVLDTLLNVLDYSMNVQDAVDAPRTHMQWLPDRIQYEPGAFDRATANTLRTMGYSLDEVRSWGSAQAIWIDPRSGIRYGGTDRRRSTGLAAGEP